MTDALSPSAEPTASSRVPRVRGSRRSGFNLIEVLSCLFILGLGVMMIAGSMPVALRSAADSQDMAVASMIGRQAQQNIKRYPVRFTSVAATPPREEVLFPLSPYGPFPSPSPSPYADRERGVYASVIGDPTSVHWYGVKTDEENSRHLGIGGGSLFLKTPSPQVGAIVYPPDPRYGYHIFYRRVPTNAAVGPYLHQFYIVVQKRNFTLGSGPVFQFPSTGNNTLLGYTFPPRDTSQMKRNDFFCTTNGVWSKLVTDTIPANFAWGVPDSVAVYQTSLTF
jgi:prepilin-type N-terminal cleavage/methylation domain-containing protein